MFKKRLETRYEGSQCANVLNMPLPFVVVDSWKEKKKTRPELELSAPYSASLSEDVRRQQPPKPKSRHLSHVAPYQRRSKRH